LATRSSRGTAPSSRGYGGRRRNVSLSPTRYCLLTCWRPAA
jgi:hypothetical protein